MTHFKSIFLHVAGGEHHGFPRILQERVREAEIKREVPRGSRKRERGKRKKLHILKKAPNVSSFPGKFSSSNIVHKYT